MRNYETVFVFQAKGDAYKTGLEAVKSIYESVGATIENEEDMGEKALAYNIKKHDRGHYHLVEAAIDPAKIDEMDKALKLKPEVLKYLFVVKA